MERMIKKTYRKPELKTRRLELGVFGDYSGGDRGHNVPDGTISVIRSLDLHMD